MVSNNQNDVLGTVSDEQKRNIVQQTVEQNNSETPNDEQMLAMYESTFNDFKPKEIVDGIVVSITDKEVLVDIGYKSEGAIPVQEFANTGMPEKMSKVKVYINAIEDGEGKLKLSKKKADFYLNLENLKKIHADDQPVTGKLLRRVKGGMMAEIMGLEAFLPGSQISLKPIPNLDQFIGKESKFKIIKLDTDRRNIIVSRKKVLEEELEEKRQFLKDKIYIDAELDGEVKNITDYGAFVDLGGIDGLLHITDMSWGRINHPSEMLNIGDKLKVKVIAFDEENQRVSLGLKQLVPHPWENIAAKYPEGTKVSGKVVNITNYGAFIELESGVEGLVHVSEMSWTKKITHPNQMVKLGDNISAIVLAVSKENQRISLGMKQMVPNPWMTIEERYPVGKTVERKIKSITPFGVFVELEDDIDGLIHISDISWTKRIYHPKEVFQKNQEVKAVVLSIDKALHRIALGVKQLEKDPWDDLDHVLPVNSEVEGTISKLIPKGVLVDVNVDGNFVEGFVPVSHLGIPKLEAIESAFDVEEVLPLKVIELDTENRRLILSVKAFYFGKDKEQLHSYLDAKDELILQRTQPEDVVEEPQEANETE
jgi:small subunit ribosomal protein S1